MKLKHCIDCGKAYDYDHPPCPHCGTPPPTAQEATERRASSAAPGWYPDPDAANTVRFWDGNDWTESRAPAAAAAKPQGISTWKGIRIVAVGILAAAATIWVVYEMKQPSDLDCSLQRFDVAAGKIEAYEMDDACR